VNTASLNKRKIVNDPVYGFINISSDFLFDLIEHPYFQRLRRIKQLGLTNYVYPGANHTRFQHAIGAAYLMDLAINSIRNKGHEITAEEAEAVMAAILLHDIGHGPFSHALENSIVEPIDHEILSAWFMDDLNRTHNGRLTLAISIFKNKYEKRFLHQLVSSQLDMDRLDYLKRDSFFTGVTEGVIGSDRIIKMLNVVDDELVVEAKGIYSIEKFLIARRLMYWQVYLHKTVLAAEKLLVLLLQRAKELAVSGTPLFATPALKFFINKSFDKSLTNDESFRQELLYHYSRLDDNDIISAAKVWCENEDNILAYLSDALINRKLYEVRIQNFPMAKSEEKKLRMLVMDKYHVKEEDTRYFCFTDEISNNAYSAHDDKIKILFKTGALKDIAEASDMLNISVLSKTVKKYFTCYPKLLT